MKLCITRGTRKGTDFFNVMVDEHKAIGLFEYSRELTGTTGEDKLGIFANGLIKFEYGTTSKTLDMGELNLIRDPAEKVTEKLAERISLVRKWVASVDKEETFSMEV